MPPPDGVLQPEHCDCLDECLRLNAKCQQILDAAREAGLPVDELNQDNAAKRALASKLKALFFPGRQ
jgi:hypothetical protein